MTDTTVEQVDPTVITSRAEFGRTLTALRAQAGLSIRDVVEASGALHGTVAGWFSGQHLPTRASEPALLSVLEACGVTDEAGHRQWLDAARRARQTRTRRRDNGPVPYRGLSAFGEEDTEWFFGRDGTTAELLGRIRSAATGDGPRVLLVIGPSGAGKSSLLRAGAAAAVAVDDSDLADWTPVVLTPATAGPDKVVAALDVDRPTVLVVDQFEEFWTCGDDVARDDFLAGLAEVGGDLVVVLGLRADFYPLAAREPNLVPILESGPVVVGPMSATELESVIIEPAKKAGVTVPDEVVQVLLADLTPRTSQSKGEPGMLPLLSHALLGMWQRAERGDLTVADYTATGGISGAVQQTAEEVFGELSDRQQRLARRVFLRLVNVEDDTQSRRRTPRTELAFGDVEAVDDIVDCFAEARLLTVDEDSVQLSHEALLTAWDRLRSWIDADRVGLTLHRGLTRAARVWEDSGRETSALLAGGRLEIHDDWSRGDDNADALNELEREFLDASLAHRDVAAAAERRRTEVLRMLVGGLTAASVVVLVLAIVAAVAGLHARTQSIDAQRARDNAMSRQIATTAGQLRQTTPSLAAQLAIAGHQVADTVEARSALLDATGVHSPVRLTGPAGTLLARSTTDGGRVVSASADGMVRIRSVDGSGPSLEPVAEFVAGDGAGQLFALAVSPDGTSVAVGGQGGVWLWDVADSSSPRLRNILADEDQVAYALEFSPDGTRLVAGTGTGALLRWNVDSTDAVALPPLTHPVEGAVYPAFSPDGRLLVVGGREMSVRVWDTASWGEEMQPAYDGGSTGGSEHVLSVAFSPDGRTVAAGTTGRHVLLWDLEDPASPAPLPTLAGFVSYVNAVAFDTDGGRLAAGSSDNTVRIWEFGPDGVAPDEPSTTTPGSNPVTSVSFSDGGRALLTGALDGAVRWWPLPGPVLPVSDVVYVNPVGSDGRLALLGRGRADTLPLWDISDHAAPRELPSLRSVAEERFSGAADLSADGSSAAAGTSSGSVHLWNTEDPANATFTAAVDSVVEGVVGAVAFAPGGNVLAVSATDDPVVALIEMSDASEPKVAGTFEAGDLPAMMSWHPTEGVLAIATGAGAVELWDVSDPAEPKPASTLTGFDSQAQAVAFGPDGRVLAAASADRSIRLWDVADPAGPRELSRITGPADAVYSLNFSFDGTRLAAGVGDGSAWVWDVSNSEQPTTYAVLTAYGSRVYDARFAGDGDVLVGGGPDRSVRLWELDPVAATIAICASVGTPITEEEWDRYLPGVPFRTPCAANP